MPDVVQDFHHGPGIICQLGSTFWTFQDEEECLVFPDISLLIVEGIRFVNSNPLRMALWEEMATKAGSIWQEGRHMFSPIAYSQDSENSQIVAPHQDFTFQITWCF
jgi:hypothetical protein